MTSSNLLLGFVFIFGCLIGSYQLLLSIGMVQNDQLSGRSSCNRTTR